MEVEGQGKRPPQPVFVEFTPGDEHKKLREVMVGIIRSEQKQFEKK